MIGKLPILGICILILGTGCASCPPNVPIGTPSRASLPTIPEALRAETEALFSSEDPGDQAAKQIVRDWLDITSERELVLRKYAKRLEARIQAHDGAESDHHIR